jgi:hypothetical protein
VFIDQQLLDVDALLSEQTPPQIYSWLHKHFCITSYNCQLKEKRSAYAPTTEQPVRYDGIYRIVRAYRKKGNQGKLVCRYLFVRCDNAAAPWSSEGGFFIPAYNSPGEARG